MTDQSSAATVEALLHRIGEVDPTLRAVCTLAPDALAQAAARDAEAREGRSRGPLHGVPVLVKDNVDTAGLATTAGSLALSAEHGAEPPLADAELVERLRAAGLVVIGKANLSEWANIRDGASTSGWSAYGGLTRNPYALNRSAGGSSSGSGAAVAAGLVPLAVGTETDGSIACPAAFNGVVGLKPTVGTVPTRGVVPVASSQDSPGPMARTVAEAAALLGVLSGDGSLADHAVPRRLAGTRIGVPRATYWGYSPHADAAAERALSLLSAAGAEVVEGTDVSAVAELDSADELTVILAELVEGVAAYLRTRVGEVPRSLAEVVAFNREHAGTELAHFGQSLFEAALEGPQAGSAAYDAARARCLDAARTRGIDAVMAAHELDALVTPAYAPACPIDLVNAEAHPGACSQPTAIAGYPLLTVPTELAAGLPVAVAFWGRAGSEATLLAVAAAYEDARDRATGPLPAPTMPDFV